MYIYLLTYLLTSTGMHPELTSIQLTWTKQKINKDLKNSRLMGGHGAMGPFGIRAKRSRACRRGHTGNGLMQRTSAIYVIWWWWWWWGNWQRSENSTMALRCVTEIYGGQNVDKTLHMIETNVDCLMTSATICRGQMNTGKSKYQ